MVKLSFTKNKPQFSKFKSKKDAFTKFSLYD